MLSRFAAKAIHNVRTYRDSVAQPNPSTGVILISPPLPPPVVFFLATTYDEKSNVKKGLVPPVSPPVGGKRNSPVESFPMTSQQSSWVLCLATSSMVYSFSALGAMVCLLAVGWVQYELFFCDDGAWWRWKFWDEEGKSAPRWKLGESPLL